MSRSLKLFEWLAYAALAVNLVSEYLTSTGNGEAIAALVMTLIAALLVWAAAKRGQVWAAWIIVVVAIGAVVTVVGDFWVGGPVWLRDILKPDATPTAREKMLDVISMLLIVAAVSVYIYGDRGQPAVSDRRA